MARVQAAGADPGDGTKWTAVEEMLDLDNYVDYLMVHMYAAVNFWTTGNWRAARRKDLDDRTDPENVIYASGQDAQRFRFFVWDAENSLRQSELTDDRTGVADGVAEIHELLRTHPQYTARWESRIALHIDSPTGVFGVDGGVQPVVGAGIMATANLRHLAPHRKIPLAPCSGVV